MGPFHHRLRRISFIVQILTLASWFLLGLSYGIGHCPITDWHWQIKAKLGETDLPNNYVHYIIEEIFPWQIEGYFYDYLVFICFFLAFFINLYLLKRDRPSQC